MTRRRLQMVGLVLALATAQGAFLFVYFEVEEGRRAPDDATFLYEELPIRPAPELTLTGLDGSSRKLSEFRGRPVLLHFWATWCPPCKEELPGLLELGHKLAGEGGPRVIAVSLDPDWQAVREFFGGAVPPEIVRDESETATTGYGLSTLPDTYLLAGDGTVRLRFFGARDWRAPRATEVLLELEKER